MLEIMVGLMVGLIISAVAIRRGPLATKKHETWHPVSSVEIRRKLKEEDTLNVFLEGQILCPICSEPVTFGNLWSIMEDDESQDFICRKPECFQEYLRNLHAAIIAA